MQVTDAIRLAIPVFTALPNADVYVIRAELVRAGIPVALAADIVEFLPVAVARAVLDGMGIRFADEYVRQTPQGRVLETKKLADEPVYREGQVVAGELSAIGDEAFLALVRRSPEYRAVSKALDAGATASDLACGPPTMIANEGDRRTFDGPAASPGRSWWQFWK
jgi:hypothetical protein